MNSKIDLEKLKKQATEYLEATESTCEFNPDTILALISTIERLEKEMAEIKGRLSDAIRMDDDGSIKNSFLEDNKDIRRDFLKQPLSKLFDDKGDV